LVEGEKWNRGMGVSLTATYTILLHFVLCVEFRLCLPRDSVVCRGWETFEFPRLLSHLTILLDFTSLVWRICSRLEIVLSGWNMLDRGLMS
jgi:hypothetical protein